MGSHNSYVRRSTGGLKNGDVSTEWRESVASHRGNIIGQILNQGFMHGTGKSYVLARVLRTFGPSGGVCGGTWGYTQLCTCTNANKCIYGVLVLSALAETNKRPTTIETEALVVVAVTIEYGSEKELKPWEPGDGIMLCRLLLGLLPRP